MKVDNFRELLIKKAGDNSTLQTLVKFMDENVLIKKVLEVLESLEKNSNKGANANSSLTTFASEIDPGKHPDMIRDAIGHHVSRYKAAISGGRQSLANTHAKQAFNIMNMTAKAQYHNDAINMKHVPIEPWERNGKLSQYTDSEHPKVKSGRYKIGDFKNVTKGLNIKTKDFSFLNKPPHESAMHNVSDDRFQHTAYPFEEVQINGKHIHIDDIDPDSLKGHEPHEFDHHPINEHHHGGAKSYSQEDSEKYLSDRRHYDDEAPHVDSYDERHDKLEEEDPEGYAARGSNPSDPVHSPVERKEGGEVSQPESKAPSSDSFHPDVIAAIRKLNPELISKLGLDKQQEEPQQEEPQQEEELPEIDSDLLAGFGIGGDDDK